MYFTKVRSFLVMAMLVTLLSVGSFSSANAQGIVVNPQPVPIGCYFQGNYYPIGTKLHFQLSETLDVTMTCTAKFNAINGIPRFVAEWVYS